MSRMNLISKLYRSIRNQAGLSLIQVLTSTSILLVLSVGFASLMTQQNKAKKILQEKMEILDYQSLLQTLVSSDDYCGCLFRNRSFNTNLGSEALNNPQLLTSLVSGYLTDPSSPTPCTPASGLIVPPAGSKLPNTNLIVRSIRFTDVSILSPGNYRAYLEVDLHSQLRRVKPIRVGLTFHVDTTTGTSATRPFKACGAGAPPPTPPPQCVTVAHPSGGYHISQVACPSGYTLTGGGCDGGVTDHFNQTRPNGNGWLCHNWNTQYRNVVSYAICCML